MRTLFIIYTLLTVMFTSFVNAQEKTAIKNNTATKEVKPILQDIGLKKAGYKLQKYNVKFSAIEEKINKLKEDIFHSKRRLLLLKEQILHNVIAEARLIIVHKNELRFGFSLEDVIYFLDGERIYFADSDTADLNSGKNFVVYNGTVVPKNHVLTVEMHYVGKSSIFSYLKGYKFKIKSSYTFYASKGKILKLTVMGRSKGGSMTEYTQKPSVAYKMNQFRYNKENLKKLLKNVK